MADTIVFILIAINIIISFIGFQNIDFFDKYKFDMYLVLKRKEYHRIITSSFLHADIGHLFFNMLTLYFFKEIAGVYGVFGYLCIYFTAVIGGDLLTIFVNKNNLNYTSIGASGGVTGIIFATIALFPNLELYVFFIPMWGWIFSILYLAYSIYGMQNNIGNIGHSAHLGGAVVGVLGALIFFPKEVLTAKAHFFVTDVSSLAVISIPILYLFFIIFKKN